MSCAKRAVAFFKISRSIRSLRTSLRRSASSCRSSLVRTPGRPWPRSARARSTQSWSEELARSRSSATELTLLPSSSTSRTAPSLNSGVNVLRGRRPPPFFLRLLTILAFHNMSTRTDQPQLRLRHRLRLRFRFRRFTPDCYLAALATQGSRYIGSVGWRAWLVARVPRHWWSGS